MRRYQDEHRLAYQLEAPVNWCPALGTVLANEEVKDGLSERGGHPVVRIPLRQWMLRITAYADRLEKDLETLDWSESIKALQRNWIGRSTGAEVDFSSAVGDGSGCFERWKELRAQSGFPRKARRRRAAHLHHAARHAVRRHLHGDCAGASARRAAGYGRARRGGAGLLRAGLAQKRPRPHRSGQGKDGRVHRLVCRQSRSTASRCRFGWPTTC